MAGRGWVSEGGGYQVEVWDGGIEQKREIRERTYGHRQQCGDCYGGGQWGR